MSFLSITRVAWFTFYQAILSTLIALLVGIPAAFFCGRRRFPGRKFLLSLSVVPFCVPTLIVALGYVSFLGINGGLNQLLMFIFGLKEPPVKILYSFAGLILAHGFYNFPIIMKTTGDIWENLPEEPSESARLLGAGEFRIFRTVTIYQLLPSIASGAMLVFIYCFLSFILVLLFGGIGNSTLEVELYKAARATLNFKSVGLLAGIETSMLVVAVSLYSLLDKRAGRSKNHLSKRTFVRPRIKGITETLGFVVLILLLITFFIAPIAGIIVNAFTSSKAGTGFTFATFRFVFKMRSFLPSLLNTLLTAACTGLCCTLLGFTYSVILKFRETKKGAALNVGWKIIPMLPMCISSVVMGVFLMWIIHRGNPVVLVLAQSALTWPLAFRVIYPQLVKIPADTMDSAFMLSRNKIDMVFRVLLPVSGKALISAFGFCFAVSAGDTTLPLVLAIPKFDTLSLFTYRLAGAYRFHEACAAGVVLGLVCSVVYLISNNLVGKE
ncbi:MAG: iron ABC transporter permease [Treponema sp.]|nr:iron ABC transporter permease [Treponema sp.]